MDLTLLLLLGFGMGLGRAVLHRTRSQVWSFTETMLFCAALGLGICAYLFFVLGLVGWLRPISALMLALLVTAPASCGLYLLGHDAIEEGAEHESPDPQTGYATAVESRQSTGLWTVVQKAAPYVAPVAIILLMVVALAAVEVPPGAHEWDALSYHLAVPQAYLMAGRIIELPTDHHSYFPFLTQMLFMCELMAQSVASAKAIHLLYGVMTVISVYCMGRRWVSAKAGRVSAFLLLLAPMAVWEAGTAYIELAEALYVVLAFHAVLLYRKHPDTASAAMSGAMSGFALAVKTLSLIPVALVVAVFAASRPNRKHVVAFAGLLAVLGAPFYLRTYLLTGNPVYPFAYSIFGGKYWDAERAAAYASEQRSYGLDGRLPTVGDDLRPVRRPYVPPTLVDRVRNAALAPFALVSFPRLFHNYNDAWFMATLGFLPLLLVPLILFVGRIPQPVRIIAVSMAVWFLVWSVSMQYARYLIPLLPLAAVVAGTAIVDLSRRFRFLPLVLAIGVLPQCYVVFVEYTRDTYSRFVSSRDTDEYLKREVNVYPSQQWLNEHAGEKDAVVLFEETRGFYLKRSVLWGNSPHSTYIPYESFRDGREMVRWFIRHGVRYALVNMQFAPQAGTEAGLQELRQALARGSMEDLFGRWYLDGDRYGEPWRRLLGEAHRSGAAVYNSEASQQATVVLRFAEESGT